MCVVRKLAEQVDTLSIRSKGTHVKVTKGPEHILIKAGFHDGTRAALSARRGRFRPLRAGG